EALAPVLAEFEAANNARVEIFQPGDSLQILNRAILEKGNPSADVLFGVDNATVVRGLAAGIFLPYQSRELANVPAQFQFDPSDSVTPVDYGYIALNYHQEGLAQRGLPPPQSLSDLAQPEYRGTLVVEDPRTSTPGLGFMLATIATFGEEGPYTWRHYWRDLRQNDLVVTESWSPAYFSEFSLYGGDRPVVVSYNTSPPYEGLTRDPLAPSPTQALLVDLASFAQIESVGILAGTQQLALAQRFVDFMLSKEFQTVFSAANVVCPVSILATPAPFCATASVPQVAANAVLDTARIAANLDRWLDQWFSVVIKGEEPSN
ncbi:MAG: thiamine ABC transporter substrate-binding protein, partial [Deinococcus sp.]|nr:thiamine ABC transporter substrate-binding protein [Deinococcus sp.]